MADCYDVFLSHNSADKPTVEELARRLIKEGIQPWLDKWNLIPGEPWQESIEEALDRCATCAVFVGPSGVSPWHNEEMRAGLDRAVRGRNDVRVIPVLLPDADPATLPPFLSRRTYVDFRSGLDDTDAFNRLVAGILGQPPEQAEPFTLPDEPAPYPGLLPFKAQQAGFFFGRTRERDRLLARVHELSFVVVVGASGSGKSSLMLAGLLPALDKGWHALALVPGARPLRALADQLATLGPAEGRLRLADDLEMRLAEREDGLSTAVSTLLADRLGIATLLIVVDQFEELFTHAAGPPEQVRRQQRQFIANLVDAAHTSDGRIRVVLALRADFVRHCLDFAGLRALLEPNQLLLGPMGEDALREAIVKPAQAVSAMFEKGLVGRLMGDMRDQPAALPLLGFALAQLWQQRQGVWLTHAAYEDIDGVSGAIDQRADAVYDRLSESQKRLARNLFVRLVALGEGGSDTRRRVSRSELRLVAVASEEVDELIGILSHRDVRLIATDADTVELAHEALIEQWGRLRTWLDEDRAALRTHRRLTETAKEWKGKTHDEGYLYRGARLAEAEEWAEAHAAEMSTLERAFLEASIARRDWEAQEEGRRRQWELEQAQRLAEEQRKRAEEEARAAAQLRRRAFWLRVTLILAMIAMMIAVVFAKQATDNETVARTEEAHAIRAEAAAEARQAIAESRALAAVARDQLDVDAERSLLLAMEAISVTHTFEAENALREALIESRVRATLPGCGDSTSICAVNDVAWSPDGAWLASALSDGTIQLWDANTRQLSDTRKMNVKVVNSLSWNPKGTQLAFGSSDGSVRLWDIKTGKPITTLVTLTNPINSVAWSPDGTQLALGSSDGSVRLWDIKTSKPITMLVGPTDPTGRTALGNTAHPGVSAEVSQDIAFAWMVGINTVAWSPDGHKLAFVTSGNLIQVWNVRTSKKIAVLAGHELAITDIAWSPNGCQLASSSYDKKVVLWDVEAEMHSATLTGHEFAVNSIAWSPEGMRLATGSCAEVDDLSNCLRGEIRLWDIETAKNLAILNGHTGSVLSVAWRPNFAQQLVSASSDGTVRLWDAETGESVKTLTGHTDLVLNVAWSPDRTQLASASQDKTIRIWSITSTLNTVILTGHNDFVSSVAWSPDGIQLASASRDRTVCLWDAKTGRNIVTLTDHTAPVNDVAWSPDGMYLASASDDRTVQVWDARRHASEHVLKGHRDLVKSVAWSPDGKRLASASYDKTVRLWDVETGQEIDTLANHGFLVTSVTWSPDGKQIAYALGDNTIQLWNVETGRNTLTLSGHERLANEVVWSPDGGYLATAANDRTVRLWDAKTGECIAKLQVHKDWVMSVAWSPDGVRLASASYDHRVRLFYASYTDLMDIAGEQVTRQLSSEERQIYLGEKSLATVLRTPEIPLHR